MIKRKSTNDLKQAAVTAYWNGDANGAIYLAQAALETQDIENNVVNGRCTVVNAQVKGKSK